uniref:Uncharacterized protein n=1 Tax=Tetranychus urticae TaxID=32264 RepID=T1JZ15_TETUR
MSQTCRQRAKSVIQYHEAKRILLSFVNNCYQQLSTFCQEKKINQQDCSVSCCEIGKVVYGKEKFSMFQFGSMLSKV